MSSLTLAKIVVALAALVAAALAVHFFGSGQLREWLMAMHGHR